MFSICWLWQRNSSFPALEACNLQCGPPSKDSEDSSCRFPPKEETVYASGKEEVEFRTVTVAWMVRRSHKTISWLFPCLFLSPSTLDLLHRFVLHHLPRLLLALFLGLLVQRAGVHRIWYVYVNRRACFETRSGVPVMTSGHSACGADRLWLVTCWTWDRTFDFLCLRKIWISARSRYREQQNNTKQIWTVHVSLHLWQNDETH
jgi:hypothetical protein